MRQNHIMPQDIRRIIIEQSKRANVGHIGSALSVADIMAALYSGILNIRQPSDPEHDRFVLSKGHAALALYAALFLAGTITREELNTYCKDGSLLGVHPEFLLNGIDFSTGSLGQGLAYGVGSALAAMIRGSLRRVFVLVSDAECNEGSLWESVMFAAHNKLSNLMAIIDLNGQQALGHTEQVLSLSPMAERWQAFGWDVSEVNGHDLSEITNACMQNTGTGKPCVIIAHTVFGKGVSYMENQIKWHYWPMSEAEYRQALFEIGLQ